MKAKESVLQCPQLPLEHSRTSADGCLLLSSAILAPLGVPVSPSVGLILPGTAPVKMAQLRISGFLICGATHVAESAPVLIYFVLTLPPLGHLLIVIDRCLLISTAVLAKASLYSYRVFVVAFCFAYITVDQSYAYTYQSVFHIFLVFARSARLICAHVNINHAVNK